MILSLKRFQIGYGILFGILILIPTSCTKLISDEFPEFESVPAVNSILVAGNPITFHVSLAEKIDSTSLTLVNDAVLMLSGSGSGSEVMTPVGDGFYASERIAIPGEIYSCLIQLEGYDDLYACDTVPEITEVKITGQTNRARYDDEGIWMEGIEFEFKDNPSTKDFYEVVLYRKQHGYSDQMGLFDENSEILLNEGLEPYTTETLVFSDHMMNDSLITMNLDFQADYDWVCWSPGNCGPGIGEHNLVLELRHISQEYYRFKKHFYLYEKNRYPYFVEGTATAFSLYSNIENGQGVIGSYALSLDSIFVELDSIPVYP